VWIAVALAAAGLWAGPAPPANRDQLYEHATALLKSGNFEQAAQEYQKIVAQWPDFFPAFSLLGVAYAQMGRLEEAGTYFQKAVRLAPNSAEARVNLGVNYLARHMRAEAAAEFEKAAAEDPRKVSAWFNLGVASLETGNVERALAALTKARALAPDDVQIVLALAEAKLKSSRPDAAMEDLHRLDEQTHGDPQMLLTAGVLLRRNDRGREASEYFRRAAATPGAGPLIWDAAHRCVNEADYQSALALLMLLSSSRAGSAEWQEQVGYTAFQLNQIEPALEHLQQAIRLDPNNEDYYLELGEVLGENNAIPALVAVFEAALRALPESLKIKSGLGVAYVMQRDYDKAEAVLKKIVEERPDYEVGYKLLAECYERAQNWTALQVLAERWRRVAAKNPMAWYYGGKAEYELRVARAEPLQAVHGYLQHAMALDASDWRPLFLLGKTLVAEHRDKEAAAMLEQAVERKPEDPSAHYLLARTWQRLGDTARSKAAMAAYKEAQANQKARQFQTLLVQIR
jgi:tetratricopeptide (TPR) repeat protein